jgi:hypothetical protein
LVHAYDLEMRDTDLETLTNFIGAKARRTLPFAAPDQNAAVTQKDRDWILPFLAEDWRQP